VLFYVDCPEPLQNLLHRPGLVVLNMGVVAIENYVTCKTRFIDKQNYIFAKDQVDRRTFESPTHKTLSGECNRLVAMLAPAEHDRGATCAL
jgi:hypothetical protein